MVYSSESNSKVGADGASPGMVLGITALGTVAGLAMIVLAVAAVYLKRRQSQLDRSNSVSCETGAEEGFTEYGFKKAAVIKTGFSNVFNGVSYEDVSLQPKSTHSLLKKFGFRNRQETIELTEEETSEQNRGSIGKLNFGLSVDREAKQLSVSLGEMRWFNSSPRGGNADEMFFFRVGLEPNETNVSQSRTLSTDGDKAQVIPVNEVLTVDYEDYKSLSNEKLIIHVISVNGCKPFGEIELSLASTKLMTGPSFSKHLTKPTKKVNGSLLLTLTWVPESNHMKIVANRAKNLLGAVENLDTYVKVTLFKPDNQTLVTRKTTVQVANANPIYGESFDFDLGNIKVDDLKWKIELIRLSGDSEVHGAINMGTTGDDDSFDHFLETLSRPGQPSGMWHKLGGPSNLQTDQHPIKEERSAAPVPVRPTQLAPKRGSGRRSQSSVRASLPGGGPSPAIEKRGRSAAKQGSKGTHKKTHKKKP